jgi:hypothetical protein
MVVVVVVFHINTSHSTAQVSRITEKKYTNGSVDSSSSKLNSSAGPQSSSSSSSRAYILDIPRRLSHSSLFISRKKASYHTRVSDESVR